MGDWLNGLLALGIGFLIWIVSSILGGIMAGTHHPSPILEDLVWIGAAIMILGPLIFWGRGLYRVIKNRRIWR